ncbi:hypothetical protein [Dactylosporangium darangshiense]|uniref:Uncharacterized protein n=1 Tax=Dactylosporangium darangshiense TaxID=579108 RepID=A0ABP8DS47_9ACTN
MRVGDLVRARWQSVNPTDQLTARGLHRDDLYLEIPPGRAGVDVPARRVRPPAARMVTAAHR